MLVRTWWCFAVLEQQERKAVMKHLSGVLAVAMVLVVAGICGCGGNDAPITQDPLLVGSWSAQNLGWTSTITFSADGTTEAFVTDPQDQDDPIHQTGTWYTQGSELVLTSPSGKVTRMDYWTDGNTFTRLEDMVSWTRM